MSAHATQAAVVPPLPAAGRSRLPGEFLRYLLVSGLAFAVDLGLFRLSLAAAAPWSVAAVVGFCGGASVAYLLSIRWVFRERTMRPASEFTTFVAIGVVGVLLTEVLLWLAIERHGLSPMPARVAVAGIVFLFNFVVRRMILFTRGSPAPDARRPS